MMAVTPASSSNFGPSGNGKNASLAATEFAIRSPALLIASLAALGRSICPAPAPSSMRSLATTIAFTSHGSGVGPEVVPSDGPVVPPSVGADEELGAHGRLGGAPVRDR